jgi:hypothetical protein
VIRTDIDKALERRERADQWRRESAQRWQEKRRRALVEVNRQGAKTTVRRPPKRSGNDWSAEVRALARARSGGVCEVCQEAPADHLHHRQPRRNRDHRIVNALHVCLVCHHGIHVQPRNSAGCGWIVHSQTDPATVPVFIPGVGRLLLTDAGGYENHSPRVGRLPEDAGEVATKTPRDRAASAHHPSPNDVLGGSAPGLATTGAPLVHLSPPPVGLPEDNKEDVA